MPSPGLIAKYTPPVIVGASFVQSIDWLMVGAIAMAFISGWAARAAVSVNARRSREHMLRDFAVSLLSSGGALLIVVGAVRQFGLDWHAAAVLAFTLSMGGLSALNLVSRSVMRSALKAVDAWRWVQDHKAADERMRFDKNPPPTNRELDELARRIDRKDDTDDHDR